MSILLILWRRLLCADRVVVMEQGKIVLDPPREVFSHVKMLKEIGLDVFKLWNWLTSLIMKAIHTGQPTEYRRDGEYIMPVKLEQVTHTYMQGGPFEATAIFDVNLEIRDGEFLGLIGHTGSGKSTLVQHMNGLLKPTQGTVIVNETRIVKDSKDLRKVRQQVGLVFQYPEHQLFEETVAKDIAFGPKNLGLSQEEIDSRVREAVQLVGLPFDEIKDRSPFELSGGQRRRVAIAGVLAMEPGILILDEPTAGLDPSGRDEIFREIKELHRKKEMTIVLVSHSMEDIARLVDRIIVMNKGQVALTGTPREVFAQAERLKEMGLDVPQITNLMLALREKGMDVPVDIYTVKAKKHSGRYWGKRHA